MHDEPIPRPERTPAEADAETQGVILAHLLLAAPTHLALDEILRELADDGGGERDPILRAVDDLARAGLLHRHGRFVFPTRAATRFHNLQIM